MDKIGLLLVCILLFNLKSNLAHAVTSQQTNHAATAVTIEKKPKQLNDPTMPKIAPIEETNELKTKKPVEENLKAINPSKLKLSMIIIKNDDKSAVINEKTVREKDIISGYEITKIESNKVILKNPKNKEDRKKIKTHSSTDPETLEPLEPDAFTELKLPSLTIKSFFVGSSSNTDSHSNTPAARKR